MSRRTLSATPLADICNDKRVSGSFLSALPDGDQIRLYFREDVFPSLIANIGEQGVTWKRIVNDAAIVEIEAPEGSGQGVRLPVVGTDARVTPDPLDLEFFNGRNVIMGHVVCETAETLCDWLTWHQEQHGADAALIILRAAPQDAEQLIEDVKVILDGPDADALNSMRIMFVDFAESLGQPQRGHICHPMNAPDAPGKDRMDPPQPEQWLSPLGFSTLFDMLYTKFLARASGVANLEVIDLVAPLPTGETMFDVADKAEHGIEIIVGDRAYPWSILGNNEPCFGDHICSRFDGKPNEARWVMAPAKLPQKTICMQRRVLGTRISAPRLRFWRYMGLRYCRPGMASIGQVVAKTSLVENSELVKFSQRLNGEPQRQGIEVHPSLEKLQRGEKIGNRTAIVTTMKNEGPFILEWVAYHRAIGVEDFIVYTNDCNDGTDDFLRLLQDKGIVQWRENPFRDTDMKPQHAALAAANDEPLVVNADWVICMDVDEYIAVHTGDGTLSALFDAVPDANLISLTWRLFGNANIHEYEDGFLTQQYFRCAKELSRKPHQAWGFKTLYRNIGLFKKLGVHRPKGVQPGAVSVINWVNGSGKPLPRKMWRNAWRSDVDSYGYGLVSLNHYAVRSAESFLVKRDRGRVNHVDRDQGSNYWFRMNHNTVEDTRMTRVLPMLQAEFDRLMADPDIRAAHEGCVAAHKAKIRELRAQPKYTAFYEELTGARMEKLSVMHGHFGSNVYLSGPEVVPDEIVEKNPDEDFFFALDAPEVNSS